MLLPRNIRDEIESLVEELGKYSSLRRGTTSLDGFSSERLREHKKYIEVVSNDSGNAYPKALREHLSI